MGMLQGAGRNNPEHYKASAPSVVGGICNGITSDIPTRDGRMLVMPRHTEPEPQQRMIPEKLNLELPPQPPPRIRGGKVELAATTANENL